MSVELEEFAATLMREVRDRAIDECDHRLHSESPAGRRWQEAAAKGTEELAKVLVTECIDQAIFQLLYAIDDGRFHLTYTSSAGATFDLAEEGLGELAGWSSEWRATYSRQRFIDYLEGYAEHIAKKLGIPAPDRSDPE